MNEKLVPLQLKFRQELPNIKGNVDYENFREQLERISEILEITGIEEEYMVYATAKADALAKKEWEEKNKGTKNKWKGLGIKACQRIQQGARQALRCAIARKHLQEAFREFTAHLADSPVLQKFCELDEWGVFVCRARVNSNGMNHKFRRK